MRLHTVADGGVREQLGMILDALVGLSVCTCPSGVQSRDQLDAIVRRLSAINDTDTTDMGSLQELITSYGSENAIRALSEVACMSLGTPSPAKGRAPLSASRPMGSPIFSPGRVVGKAMNPMGTEYNVNSSPSPGGGQAGAGGSGYSGKSPQYAAGDSPRGKRGVGGQKGGGGGGGHLSMQMSGLSSPGHTVPQVRWGGEIAASPSRKLSNSSLPFNPFLPPSVPPSLS
jgi:hypothetical protein